MAEVSPCINQTREDIEAYYRKVQVGDKAVVRRTQGHLLQYSLTEIEGMKPERGRVYVRGFGAFYMKSGANCFHPKGQTTLVVPSPEIEAWVKENPHGKFDVRYYPELVYPFGSALPK